MLSIATHLCHLTEDDTDRFKMTKMKTLLLFALALHVTIIIVESNGRIPFGSILSFPRKCDKKNVPLYKHFALYVGNEFPGMGDIVHYTGKITRLKITFGNLKDEGDYQIDNYLDGLVDTDDAAIKLRVQTLIDTKGYNLFTNNCEHAATYLRYGISCTLQKGSKAEKLVTCIMNKNCPHYDKISRRIDEGRAEEQCKNG